MTCGRCGGFMVVESMFDAIGLTISGELQEVRCLNCGNLEDTVIVANRVLAQTAEKVTCHNFGVEVDHSL